MLTTTLRIPPVQVLGFKFARCRSQQVIENAVLTPARESYLRFSMKRSKGFTVELLCIQVERIKRNDGWAEFMFYEEYV